MNAQILQLDAMRHLKVQKLLPWMGQGTLTDAERRLVEAHLARCNACREDLAWERKLQGGQPAPGLTPDMERALTLLMPQLHTPPAPPVPRRRWMPWALAVQLLLIAGLAAQLAGGSGTGDLDARTAHAGAVEIAAHITVVFRPDTSERQLRAILQANAARVVDGPSGAHAWLLAVAPSRRDAALAGLRADAAVELAEPLRADAPQ